MTEPALGQIIADRFRLDGRLGRGGYGDVYRARQLSVDRDVAIKLVHTHLEAREDVRARFEREARLASRVRHPNVVQVIDFGEDDGRLFLAMQYIPGETLKTHFSRALPTLRDAADWIAGIASGLAAAHREGLVHRDLKPGNVILTPTPSGLQPVVIDFGLVKAFADPTGIEEDVTHSNMLVGTPTYMSPEVVLGHPIDAKSDLYSLGVLAYVLLTGHKPVQGATPIETASLHLRGDIPDVRERRPDCPAPLAALVGELLERDPEKRPANADAVAVRASRVATALSVPNPLQAEHTMLPTVGPAAAAAAAASRGAPARLAPTSRRAPLPSTETLTAPSTDGPTETDTVPLAAASAVGIRRRNYALGAVALTLTALFVGWGMWPSSSADFAPSTDSSAAVERGAGSTSERGTSVMATSEHDEAPERQLPTAAVGTEVAASTASTASTASATPSTLPSDALALPTPAESRTPSPEHGEDPGQAVAANAAPNGNDDGNENAAVNEIGNTVANGNQPDQREESARSSRYERRSEVSAAASAALVEDSTDDDADPEPVDVAASRSADRARSAPGFLTVTPNPWGEVFIDGRSLGPRPLWRHELPPGDYQVEVRYGDQVERETVRIRADETRELHVRFEVE